MPKSILNVYYKDDYVSHNFKYFSTLRDMKRILKVISKEAGKKIEASVHFIDSNGIKQLNNEHRGLNMTTDVLSFPHNEKDGKYLYIGDVFINMDILEAQSESISSDEETEVKFLAMHGLLHLIGYDHLEKEDEKKMCQRQREIFTKLRIRNDIKRKEEENE